jgi:hypothetical protein
MQRMGIAPTLTNGNGIQAELGGEIRVRRIFNDSRTQAEQENPLCGVGLGHIAQVAVLPAFKNSGNSELFALVSGDETKLRKLGKKYKVGYLYSYEDYGKVLSNVMRCAPHRLESTYSARSPWR